jgi:hypothetical protein
MQEIHENKENKVNDTQSHLGGILSLLESTNYESQNHDHSLHQDPHYQGFKLTRRNYFILKIDMRKFDGKYCITGIFQMEQFFDVHQTPSLQKVLIASLCLENDQFVWYQWLCERKNKYIISWSIFIEESISHHGDIKSNTLFSQLINIRQKGPITKRIQQFQKINIMVKNIPEDNLLDIFMGTLNENIQHEVHLFEPKSLEQAFNMARKVENKNMPTRRMAIDNYREHHVPSPKPTRLTPQQMDERRAKAMCFNCDNKYNKGNKCSEKKLFYIDCEEEEDQ